jgi:hypothetical protein
MRVKALATIYAGSDIHPPGTVFTINPTDGQDLVSRGFAEVADAPADEDPTREPRRKK